MVSLRAPSLPETEQPLPSGPTFEARKARVIEREGHFCELCEGTRYIQDTRHPRVGQRCGLCWVDYHDLFRSDLTAQDAADEQAHRARLDAQADAAEAEIAEIEALLREEDDDREDPGHGEGGCW